MTPPHFHDIADAATFFEAVCFRAGGFQPASLCRDLMPRVFAISASLSYAISLSSLHFSLSHAIYFHNFSIFRVFTASQHD